MTFEIVGETFEYYKLYNKGTTLITHYCGGYMVTGNCVWTPISKFSRARTNVEN